MKDQELVGICRKLKVLAKELSITIIVLSQLSASIEKRDNKRPMISEFKELRKGIRYFDTVMFLYRDECYYENHNKELAEVIIDRSRDVTREETDLS